METQTYKGYTIKLDYDQNAESPADWGNYTISMRPSLRLIGNGPVWSRYVYDEVGDHGALTIAARAMLKSGRLWPIRYSSHGPQCSYDLAYDSSDADGFIEFTAEYAKNFNTKAGRKTMATQDLETYTQWANGDVYGITITDSYGDTVDALWGLYGYEDALQEAKAVIDHHDINYASKAPYAAMLHHP